MYFFTHLDNEHPDLFRDFCDIYLPHHQVDKITGKQRNQTPIILIIMVPAVERLDPIQYFSERTREAVEMYGLKGTINTFSQSHYNDGRKNNKLCILLKIKSSLVL